MPENDVALDVACWSFASLHKYSKAVTYSLNALLLASSRAGDREAEFNWRKTM
jgi:hypothetical protein